MKKMPLLLIALALVAAQSGQAINLPTPPRIVPPTAPHIVPPTPVLKLKTSTAGPALSLSVVNGNVVIRATGLGAGESYGAATTATFADGHQIVVSVGQLPADALGSVSLLLALDDPALTFYSHGSTVSTVRACITEGDDYGPVTDSHGEPLCATIAIV